MGDGEALGAGRVHAVCQDRQRDGRGVGGDDRVGPGDSGELLVEALLDIRALHDHLDDPVDIGEPVEVVFEVAGGDVAGAGLVHKGRGVGLQRLLDRALGHRVAVGRALGHDVQQVHLVTGVGTLRRNAHAHHTGPDDGDFPDLSHVDLLSCRARAQAASMMVAMP